MALTLTIGTNTWVTLAQANNYFEGKWNAGAWTGLSDTQKKQLLISAYEWISGEPDYVISGITNKLRKAQMELAWFIYNNDSTYEKHEALWASGVRDFDVSKFSETLEEPSLPIKVKNLLKDYDYGSGGYVPLQERDVSDNM
jgi:hypothetical protein